MSLGVMEYYQFEKSYVLSPCGTYRKQAENAATGEGGKQPNFTKVYLIYFVDKPDAAYCSAPSTDNMRRRQSPQADKKAGKVNPPPLGCARNELFSKSYGAQGSNDAAW